MPTTPLAPTPSTTWPASRPPCTSGTPAGRNGGATRRARSVMKVTDIVRKIDHAHQFFACMAESHHAAGTGVTCTGSPAVLSTAESSPKLARSSSGHAQRPQPRMVARDRLPSVRAVRVHDSRPRGGGTDRPGAGRVGVPGDKGHPAPGWARTRRRSQRRHPARGRPSTPCQ
jgi:hypothetical protein